MSEVARPETAYHVSPPDDQLIRDAMSGDKAAVADLCELLRPIVLGYCLRRVGSQDSGAGGAEDCTQEVMSAVLTVLPRYRYRYDRFLAWVFGIAAHKIADLRRARQRRGEKLEPLPDPDTAAEGPWTIPGPDELDRLDQRLQAGCLLRRLPDAQRRVLVLRIVFGFSARECAGMLGMPSAGAVRVAQLRALDRLRQTAPATR
jgi:RNA polymerase sigma-70 factor (ECF subfamily)